MIRLYWYNKKPNFGYQLSPVLCRMLSGQDVEYTGNFELCDLVGIIAMRDPPHSLLHEALPDK